MTLLLIAALILAVLLIILGFSLARREPNEVTIDVVSGGNGASQRDYTEYRSNQ